MRFRPANDNHELDVCLRMNAITAARYAADLEELRQQFRRSRIRLVHSAAPGELRQRM